MSLQRISYLLTTNNDSERTLFSKSLLEKIGFNVVIIMAVKHDNPIISNKISMLNIYEMIKNSNDEWSYIFEDDINILESISLNEIVEYEKISNDFFYLGLCKYGDENTARITNHVINGMPVFIISGCVRGLHAIAVSKKGASKLIDFIEINNSVSDYMDVILEQFSLTSPANVIRYDLESYVSGHKGIFFQDRKKFPSKINNNIL